MKTLKLFSSVLLMIGLSSCSDSDVELAKKINNDPEMQGKEIELEGKINTKFEVLFSGRSKIWNVNFDTSNALNNQDSESVSVNFNYAKGVPNSIYIDIPKGQRDYKSTDLKVYDKDGKEFTSAESFKIKGKVGKENTSVIITDITIEK